MGGEGDLGGGLGDLGGPMDDGSGGDINGAEGSMPTQDMGGAEPPASEAPPMESVRRNKPLINESAFDKYVRALDEGVIKEKEVSYNRADVYDSEALLINEEFDKMIKALSKFVDDE
jgi:hypothetical protein